LFEHAGNTDLEEMFFAFYTNLMIERTSYSSHFKLGGEILLINPQCDGEWFGAAILSSDTPAIASIANTTAYIPHPIPETVRLIILVLQLLYD